MSLTRSSEISMDPKRRNLLLSLAGLTTISHPVFSKRLTLTPRQMAGPFYPDIMPLDDDNDLTRVAGRPGKARGQITDLSGKLLDINGKPLSNHRIEIWQCDANGRYRHTNDNQGKAIDENFQGFGHTLTDRQGNYRFRTIKPVAYPGRTPHMHIAVFPKNEQPFITQLYVSGEPRNQYDFLFTRIPVEKRHRVVAGFNKAEKDDRLMAANFDIVLDTQLSTPA